MEKNVLVETFHGLVFHGYIYRREDVMPHIHSHFRSGRRQSLQVPHLRTRKDYLCTRVSGQSSYWQKGLRPLCRIKTTFFCTREKKEGYVMLF